MWLIGNGASINTWRDPWLTNITRWPSFINVNVNLEEFIVADFILSDNTWNLSPLAGIFNTDMMTIITSLPLVQSIWSDQLGWAKSRSLTVSSKDIGAALFSSSSLVFSHHAG